jgi:hypothetical protein
MLIDRESPMAQHVRQRRWSSVKYFISIPSNQTINMPILVITDAHTKWNPMHIYGSIWM